jgi:hypothetical protein
MSRRTKLPAEPSPRESSPFEILAEASFDAAGTWVIRVTANFRDGVPPEGSDLYGEARVGALLAIMKAGHEGRRLGATTARVYLDMGDGVRVIEPSGYPTTLH